MLTDTVSRNGARLVRPSEETNSGAYWLVDWPDGGYWLVSFEKGSGDYAAKKYMPGPRGEGEYVVEELTDERARGLAWFLGLYCEWGL